MHQDSPGIYHLVGVGGVGMSALAQLLLLQGHDVSGSDRLWDQGETTPVLDRLEAAGLRRVAQNGSAVHPGLSAVIYSTAVEADNPERVVAVKQDVPLIHRAEMLARALSDQRIIAVAGTSGKTTVTGMIGWLLERAGFDPTVVNGGELVDWSDAQRLGSVRVGSGEWAVIEADESDRSFLQFSPDWTVITNISRDHFDLNETVDLFRTFTSQTTAGIICPAEILDLLKGTETEARWVSTPLQCADDARGWCFKVGDRRYVEALPGRHNAENATMAVALCEQLGVPPATLAEGLQSFRGIRRRLEVVGASRGVTIVDDYAHNPAKIRAAWTAMNGRGRRVLGLWRPHGFGPLAHMMEDLAATFADVMHARDQLFVLPVFYAGGTAERSVSASSFVSVLRSQGVHAVYTEDYPQVAKQLLDLVRPDDIVLIMGARDPHLPVFARELMGKLV
jgi:UDP-N-acetylmuramate--alanine ligase